MKRLGRLCSAVAAVSLVAGAAAAADAVWAEASADEAVWDAAPAADAVAYGAEDYPVGQWNEGWSFAVTPYVYAPAIKGDFHFNRPIGSGDPPFIDISTGDDAFSSLDAAFMISAEAEKGRWGVLADLLYADLSKDATLTSLSGPRGDVEIPVNGASDLDFTTWVLTFVAGAKLGQPGGRADMQAFAGVRYADLDADASWSLSGSQGALEASGSVSGDEEIFDGVAGVRGRVGLGDQQRWKLTYYADVGAGDSDLTWQLVAGVGYSYGWGDLRFAWRWLSYERPRDELVRDLDINGPALGATFRF